MTLHDPLDAYTDMLRAESAENDNLLDDELPLTMVLKFTALHVESNRQRFEADREMEEQTARVEADRRRSPRS